MIVGFGMNAGITTTGFGIVREEPDGQVVALAYGVLETPKTDALPDRLLSLRQQLIALLQHGARPKPRSRRYYFATNLKTAMIAGQARGVILVTLHEAGVPIGEYTPLQVKQAITGYGQAAKRQMQIMVQTLLALTTMPKPDDAADALAIAITHIHSAQYGSLSAGSAQQ